MAVDWSLLSSPTAPDVPPTILSDVLLNVPDLVAVGLISRRKPSTVPSVVVSAASNP